MSEKLTHTELKALLKQHDEVVSSINNLLTKHHNKISVFNFGDEAKYACNTDEVLDVILNNVRMCSDLFHINKNDDEYTYNSFIEVFHKTIDYLTHYISVGDDIPFHIVSDSLDMLNVMDSELFLDKLKDELDYIKFACERVKAKNVSTELMTAICSTFITTYTELL